MEQRKIREQFRRNLIHKIDSRQCMQQDLAEYCGVSHGTVCHWVNGRAYPRADMMAKIASFFGVSVFELVCEGESDEEILLKGFRVLSPYGKQKALERMDELKHLYWYDKKENVL